MSIVKGIFDLLIEEGNKDYIGENVTQIEHMIQAGLIAEKKNYNPKKIIACLLHDIGHLLDAPQMDNLGVYNHEKVGADFLRSLGIDEYVCNLIENHANAKRYLLSTDVEYIKCISSASINTMKYQGGLMGKKEQLEFEKLENFQDCIDLRKIDDMAKVPNEKLVKLEHFLPYFKYCSSDI